MIRGRGGCFLFGKPSPAPIRPVASWGCLRPTRADHCARSEIGRGFRRPTFPPERTRDGSPSRLSPLRATAPQSAPARPGSHESRQEELCCETFRRRWPQEIQRTSRCWKLAGHFLTSGAQELLPKRTKSPEERRPVAANKPGLCKHERSPDRALLSGGGGVDAAQEYALKQRLVGCRTREMQANL